MASLEALLSFLPRAPQALSRVQIPPSPSPFKVAPWNKLAVRSLSTYMARALKSARRPRKNKTNMASQFRNIPPKHFINFLLNSHCAKSLISAGQTFMRGDNVTPVTSHHRSPR